MTKVIIEVEITKGQDKIDPDYTRLDVGQVTVRGEDLTDEDLDSLADRWGQSDWFYVEFTADVLNGMDR